ncbi:MAG: biotin--[acetyl-CoA-carboxylase] ligase [Planctomycetota bacterium]
MDAPLSEETISGHRVLVITETGSTNALAMDLAARGELGPGDAVFAMRQTAGRGRRGRAWITVPDRSLATSVLVAPPALPRPATLGLLAAVATCRALEQQGAEPLGIKWPNDIMRGESKVGGLLLEHANDPAGGTAGVVVGIGVNLGLEPGDLPPDLEGSAGDVGLPASAPARRELLGRLLEHLDRVLADCADPSGKTWRDEYRVRAWLPGRRADLLHGGRPETAVIADVTSDGDLVLADGRCLPGEHVELLAVGPRRRADPAH